MITIYSESKEARNNAMPSQLKKDSCASSAISDSLEGMRDLIKKNLNIVKKIDWGDREKCQVTGTNEEK